MWKEDLIRVVQECRAMNEGQRFGQLLYNLICTSDIPMDALPDDYDAEFHARLFLIEDDKLVEAIKEWFDGRFNP